MQLLVTSVAAGIALVALCQLVSLQMPLSCESMTHSAFADCQSLCASLRLSSGSKSVLTFRACVPSPDPPTQLLPFLERFASFMEVAEAFISLSRLEPSPLPTTLASFIQ